MAVAAGSERDVLSMTLGAFINNQPTSFCPTFHDGFNHLFMITGHGLPEGCHILRSEGSEYFIN